MHSRILALSTEPIEPYEEILNTSDVEESGFVPWIGDYCDMIAGYPETLVGDYFDRLSEQFPGYIEHDNKTIVFKEGFRTQFLISFIGELQKRASIIKGLDDYKDNSGLTMKLYSLKSWIEDKHGLYIFWDGFWTENAFFQNLQEETVYYVGNIIDYHY